MVSIKSYVYEAMMVRKEHLKISHTSDCIIWGPDDALLLCHNTFILQKVYRGPHVKPQRQKPKIQKQSPR